MEQEKLNSVINYFKQDMVELPTEVINAITDVFEENDNIDSVEVYYKNDLDKLIETLKLKKEVYSYIDNTPSRGQTTDTFTYYGDVDWSYAEKTQLLQRNEDGTDTVLVDITNIPADDPFVSENSWAVILLETISWDNNKIDKEDVFIIYAPVTIDEDIEDGESIYG